MAQLKKQRRHAVVDGVDTHDLKLIGVSYDDFRRHIYPNYHKEVRVVVIDGQHQACDADLNPARCNISITHGVISGVVGYY